MVPNGSWPAGRVRFTSRLFVVVGVVAVLAGGPLVGMTFSAGAVTPKITLALTKGPGAACSGSLCTKLAGGDVLSVTGTGFSANQLASILECNDDPAQPVVLYLGNYIPVSCTKVVISATSKKGVFGPAPFTVVEGITGPPATPYTPTCVETSTGSTTTTSTIPNCTTSGNETTDAAKYQCPPSAPQITAGDTCVVAVGDILGERAIGTVLFGTETLPSSTTTTTGGSTTTTGGSTTTTSSTTTTTSPTSTSTATQVSASSVTLGPSGTVSDTVTVRGTPAHGSPSGNVDFYVCQTGTTQTLTGGPCPPGAPSHLATAHLSAALGNSATASSGAFVPTAAGTWCFSAVYGGSSPYTGSADNTSATNLDANECVLVAPASSTTASFISTAKVTLGSTGSATDSVTVSGNVVGGPPGGGVSFYVCHISSGSTLVAGACPPAGVPEDAAVDLVPGAGASSSATSKAFVPTAVGTWCFSALYGGSPTYAESGDNTSAATLDTGECLLVAPPPGDAITSAANASGTAGQFFTFPVTTSGSPTPSFKRKGRLPKGVHFVNNHDGTATISGTPSLTKGVGIYHIRIKATFGKGKTKTVVYQAFTLTMG